MIEDSDQVEGHQEDQSKLDKRVYVRHDTHRAGGTSTQKAG
jgi:hypothetical protein